MMLQFLLFLYVCTFSVNAEKENYPNVLGYSYQNYGNGDYYFSFKTSNGIERNETGHIVDAGKADEHIVVKGYYSYIDPDGNIRVTVYTADEKGYQASFNDERQSDGTLITTQKPDVIFNAPAAPVSVSGPLLASLLGR